MFYGTYRRKRLKPTTRKGGNNNHKWVKIKKDDWERACYELFKDAYTIDYHRTGEIAKSLGISPVTFEKYIHLWIANGRKTDGLAIIAKEDSNNDDKNGNRESVEGIQDLPKVQRRYKRTL